MESPAAHPAHGERPDPIWIRTLDEAIRTIEWRRYQRLFTSVRLPLVYAIGIFLTAGVLTQPMLAGIGAMGSGSPTQFRGWAQAALLTVCGLAAIVAAYLRVQALWQQERRMQGILAWLLTRQSPVRVGLTTIAMAAVMGMLMVTLPAAFGAVFAIPTLSQWWQLPLALLEMAACALLGSAVGAANFFVGYKIARSRWFLPGLGILCLAAVGLWLGLEARELGWQRPWEEHPGRMTHALLQLTPVPTLFGVLCPGWWNRILQPTLLLPLPIWAASLLTTLWLLLCAGYAAWVAVRGYLLLAEDPDRLEGRPRAARVEGGQEYYWQGFRNPVLTRDIRTRLREKETAEFIGFSSIAVAAGAFVPLVLTASDLSDPLQTAAAARQVFFWLTMTLIALVTLIAPGLTADVISQERERGSLELLISTPLRGRQILIGKLLGAVAVVLLLVSPSLPLFGLCYLFHGASGLQVVVVFGLVAVCTLSCCFIGLMQSAINGRAGLAKVWAYATTILFVLFPGGPIWIAAATAAPQADLRQSLLSGSAVSAVIAIIWSFVFVLFWGNALEQLEYAEV